MSALVEMRTKFKDQIWNEQDIKLGFMSAFARTPVLALINKEIPAPTRSSIAIISTPKLVTPVLRNSEAVGFLDIEKGIAGLGKKET